MSGEFRRRWDWLLGMGAPGRLPGRAAMRAHVGCGVAVFESVPAGVVLGLASLETSFEELMRVAIGWGGDVDTVASMAGSLWGLHNGPSRLPTVPVEGRERLRDLAGRLSDRVGV